MLRPCPHQPACPEFDSPDAGAAMVIAGHDEQGWRLLCNGTIAFEDGSLLLPSDAVRMRSERPALGPTQ